MRVQSKARRFCNVQNVKGKLLTAMLLTPACFTAMAATVNVYNADELQDALINASAGDEIIVNPGSYVGSKGSSGNTKAHFFSDRSGNASNPIVIRSKSSSNKQVLQGESVDSGYIFYLTGDHWQIEDLKFSTAQKGIMLEGANNNVIDNVSVWNVGAEAVHFRYFSSNNTLKNCYIYDTGKRTGQEGFGEGVYVGTHDGHTSAKLDNSNNNRIGGCRIGPNVTAEAFDIKSGTSGTIIESNYISGEGIIGTSGNPAADSFIDLKGTDVIIRNNVMDWKNDNNVAHAIFTYQEHRSSNIYDNEIRLDNSAPTFKLLEETVHATNNIRLDGGTKLVEQDYQNNKIDDELDQTIEQPAYSYTCFDELSNGCGTEPNEPTDPPTTTDPTGPDGFTLAAEEGETVQVTGTMDIAYGADDSFNYKYNQTNDLACSNGVFGDPIPGVRKYCFVKSVSTPPPSTEGCDGTTAVVWKEKTEINIADTNCISFSEDLSNASLQAWDSDENSSCNFRGEIESVTNSSVYETVTGNYHSFSNLSGKTFKLVPNNNCQYIKVRAY